MRGACTQLNNDWVEWKDQWKGLIQRPSSFLQQKTIPMFNSFSVPTTSNSRHHHRKGNDDYSLKPSTVTTVTSQLIVNIECMCL